MTSLFDVRDDNVNIFQIIHSLSLLTNCTIALYDFQKQCIVFANVSHAAHFCTTGGCDSHIELQNQLGEKVMAQIKEVCERKNDFLKSIKSQDRPHIVVSGKLDLSESGPISYGLPVSFMGVSVAFTNEGDIKYELFKTHIGGEGRKEIEIYNGLSGERWCYNLIANRWMKLPALELSDMEKQIVSMSIMGMSSQQIAEMIHKSEITVKKAKSHIMQAVNASTMTEAAFLLAHRKFK